MVDRHSRIVGWLKVVLPLAALALLATLFLIADRIDPSAAIPYAQVDVEDLARDPRMTGATYSGTTQDGAAINVTAETARPASGDRGASASSIVAKMTMPSGGQAVVRAGAAQIAPSARELELTDGVTVEASSGYSVLADGLALALNRSRLASLGGEVTATGPAGEIRADRFTLTQEIREDAAGEAQPSGDYLLVFSGRVRLIYQPEDAPR